MAEHFNLSRNASSLNYDEGILSLEEEEDPRGLATSYMMYKVGKLQNVHTLCILAVIPWNRRNHAKQEARKHSSRACTP